MRYRELLALVAVQLAGCGIEDARFEAEVIVREAAGISRARLYAHADDVVPAAVAEKAEVTSRRRGQREPLAYIIGRKEFYGLDFLVDPRVLIPRPETEMLVDVGISAARRLLARQSEVAIADIGTGSGAIAVSVATNVPAAIVYAVDFSAASLEVAAANCRRHGVEGRVRLLRGDLLRPLPAQMDIILANLPYIKDVDLADLPPEIREFEPISALKGGKAGLNLIRRLLRQATTKVSPGGMIALEIAYDQGRSVASFARAAFPEASIKVRQDLAGLDRVVEIDLGTTEERE